MVDALSQSMMNRPDDSLNGSAENQENSGSKDKNSVVVRCPSCRENTKAQSPHKIEEVEKKRAELPRVITFLNRICDR